MSDTKTNLKKYILSASRIAVAAFAMYLAGRKVNWPATWEIVKGLNLGILAIAVLLLLANTVIVASRWYLLLRLQSINIGLMPAIKLTFVGFSYNQFLPSSVGGDVLRAWYVTKHTPKKLEAVLSVFVDRLVGFIGLLLSAVAAFLLFPKTLDIAENLRLPNAFKEYWWVFPALIGLLMVALAAAMLVPRMRLMLTAVFGYAAIKGRQLFVKASKAVFLYFCRPVLMLLFLLMTLFCQTLFIFGLWLAGRELGVNVTFAYYLVFIPISWVIGMLPISIGGVGVMEGIMALLFAKLAGVNYDNAFALAMCQRFLFLIVSLPGLFVHIAGAHVPAEFSIDSEAGIN